MAGIGIPMAGAVFLGRYLLKRCGLWNGKTGMILGSLSAVIFPLGGFLMLQYGYHPLKIFRYWLLMYGLVLLGILDADQKRIPNQALLLMLAARTILLVGECLLYGDFIFEIVCSALVGLAGGTLLFLITAFFARKGIGMGDVKLVGTVGYYLGFQVLMSDLIITMLLTVLVGAGGLLIKKMSLKTEMPFAPFMAAGTILTLLAGC